MTSPLADTNVQPFPRKSRRRDWLSLAKTVSPVVEAEIPAAEQARTLTAPVVDALKQTELFWMLAPTEVGGGGCSYRDIMEVIEELSWADASAGWSFMANAESIAAAGAFCGPDAIDAMFGGKERAIVAGMLGPGGKGVQVEGGYLGGGSFSFGSGSGHADWLGGGLIVLDEGKPRMQAYGPEVRICFMPRDKVVIKDNWFVAGLSATGSFDYEIPEQFFGSDFTLDRAVPVQRRGQALFTLGFAPIVAMGHAAVVLGIMKRALQEVARIASDKKRVGYPGPIADYPLFLYEFGTHEASYVAARNYAIAIFEEAETAAEDGRAISDYDRARFRQVASWVHKIGSDVVRFCYTSSGSEGFRGSTAIGRAFRDMHVASNHLFIDPVTIANAAPAIVQHYRENASASPGIRG